MTSLVCGRVAGRRSSRATAAGATTAGPSFTAGNLAWVLEATLGAEEAMARADGEAARMSKPRFRGARHDTSGRAPDDAAWGHDTGRRKRPCSSPRSRPPGGACQGHLARRAARHREGARPPQRRPWRRARRRPTRRSAGRPRARNGADRAEEGASAHSTGQRARHGLPSRRADAPALRDVAGHGPCCKCGESASGRVPTPRARRFASREEVESDDPARRSPTPSSRCSARCAPSSRRSSGGIDEFLERRPR